MFTCSGEHSGGTAGEGDSSVNSRGQKSFEYCCRISGRAAAIGIGRCTTPSALNHIIRTRSTYGFCTFSVIFECAIDSERNNQLV